MSDQDEITFVAVLPHSAGLFTAQEVKVVGADAQAILDAAWGKCIGSRYVSRIVAVYQGLEITVYTEGTGWLTTDPRSQAELFRLSKGGL